MRPEVVGALVDGGIPFFGGIFEPCSPTELWGKKPGEEMTITDHGHPLAHVKKADRNSWPCKAGSYRKAEFWMAPDFDAPLDDFKEYME